MIPGFPGAKLTPDLCWLVSADDLTGALDVGAQFARVGLPTTVCLGPLKTSMPPSQVMVYNSDSRGMEPAMAREAVAQGMEFFGKAGFYFKKTDSTLRGNPGAEMEVFMAKLGINRLVFVPAYPKAGRVTRNGIHFVENVPVHQSSFGRDPLNPVGSSQLSDLFSNATFETHSRPYLFPEKGKPAIFIPDCESDDDLNWIASSCHEQGVRAFGGSAGFVEALLRRQYPTVAEPPVGELKKPCLLVNGSLNPVSLLQMRHLQKHYPLMILPPSLLAQNGFQSIPSRGSLLLGSALEQKESKDYLVYGATLGMDPQATHHRMAEQTALLIRQLLETRSFASLVVSGGATFAAIARGMGWEYLVPKGEISPGLSASNIPGSELQIVSKSGGFGDEALFSRLLS